MSALLAELKKLRRKPDGDVYDPDIKRIASRIGADHKLALTLWDTGDTAA